MKKTLILILLACIAFYMCGFKKPLVLNTPLKNDQIITDEKVQRNDFFFDDITTKRIYNVRQSLSDEIPLEMSLRITLSSQYENGRLYRIECDYVEHFPERYEGGVDRLSLGYFYVQDNSSVIYQIREENMTDELEKSEEKIMSAGTVVCQEKEKKDILGEGENGWHEWIVVDNDRREYHSYNDLTGTGFYEQFIWERGYGLIYYTSGFGADKDMIEMTLEKTQISI